MHKNKYFSRLFYRSRLRVVFMVGFICLCCTCKRNHESSQILEDAGIKGGLIVHLGCNDGRLTAALGQKTSYVVQGLEVDEKKVRQARETIRSSGRYGRISVRQWDGQHLPYAENLVKLIVAQDPGEVELEEMMRVLVPNGVAMIRARENWLKKVKPWPTEIDEWPHYFYGPDNNAVSKDQKVGPPQCMQWVCGPAYARSHEINSSMAAMVSAQGRIFYIWDEGPLGQPEKRFPSQWSLIARDGFNGMLLWKLPLPGWGWRQWHEASRWDDPRERATMLRQLPRTTTRRLVAKGERLYVTLGYQAPVSVLDASTGDLINTIKGTQGTDEILLDSQMLVLSVRNTDHPDNSPGKDFRLSQNPGRIMTINLQNNKIIWQSEPDTIMPLTLAIRNDHVYYVKNSQVVCLDRASCQPLWRSEPVKGKGQNGTLVAHDQVVFFAYGPVAQLPEKRDYQIIRYHQAHAFSAESGEKLWSSPLYRGPSGNGQDIFIIDGLAWFGVDNQENLPDHWQDATTQRMGYDLLTGEAKRRISVPKLTSPGHHYRCYRSKATERFLLLPKRGVEFLDLQHNDHMRNDWLRAPCTYGAMPANGILYTAPHQCVCYQGVLMSNFNALTARSQAEGLPFEITRDQQHLCKGSKYGQVKVLASNQENTHDWPMYRHDPRRSGRVNTDVPYHPDLKWEAAYTSTLTPPVVAGRTLLVAEKDAHTLHALDANTGHRLWHYTVSARIDSPPTVYGPLVLFGSSDGWVYCLDISDGNEIWRFLAAPRERLVGAFGQVESAWPVHGSVVVQPDVTSTPERSLAYFTAGRSTFLDGGIYAYALDPWTGELVHHICLRGPHPDPYTDQGGAGYMDGAKSDILVSDGVDLFLHQERFRSDLKRSPAPMEQIERERGGFRIFPPAPERGSSAKHLISTRGFLDDSYNEGTYWTYGARWPGWDRKMRNVPFYGQLLSFDDDRVYGVNVFYTDIRVRMGFFPGTMGYRLFARDHDAGKDRWSVYIPVRVRAMVAAGDKLFVAGPPDVIPEEDPLAAFEGRMGSYLWSFSLEDGQKLAEIAKLDGEPVYDGLIAADQHLFMSMKDGRMVCYGR
jgi:outer membrane protein assembly factor BamB